MTDAPADTPIRDAATVIVLDRSSPNGPTVLMGQRGSGAAFMPSKYVFPGGAVDAADADVRFSAPSDPSQHHRLAAEPARDPAPTPESLLAAALRELAEETGMLTGAAGPAPEGWDHYARAGLSPDPAALIFLFRAITPPGRTRRYDARFFLLDATRLHGDRNDFSAACDELSHLHWVPLDEARALDLPFITEVVMAEVAAIARTPAQLAPPEAVPFFDNRAREPRFLRIR
ncbi:NUDIX domain-containing protein [Paracoccus sp. CPCC 101403]|uniref:NUDIX domain-containing protein n=1 Tax=Paracoccus broussonetiae TaxID=3075834 RepID=A0ABU3EAA4_9RHOB|nr:NUDIX domain-containing protein [Paracoccus sp. CPCC 101403]MDT1061149.1 NUDIX domain-containing protein [Paracoccus sp. CPCC 101403]